MLGFGQFIQEGNYVQSSVLQYTEPRHCGEDQKQRNVRLSAKLNQLLVSTHCYASWQIPRNIISSSALCRTKHFGLFCQLVAS